MAFEVGQINRDIISNIQISLASSTDIVGGGADIPRVAGDTRIPIQFPPKVTTDSKSANWEKIDVANFEPIAIFMGAESRKLGIELTYVVTEHSDLNMTWDGETIAQVVRRAKSILYQSVGSNAFLTIRNLYGTVGNSSEGSSKATFRVMGVAASYSDNVIISGGNPYPFKTTLTFDLENYTSVNSDTTSSDRTGASEGVGKLVDLPENPGIAESASSYWY